MTPERAATAIRANPSLPSALAGAFVSYVRGTDSERQDETFVHLSPAALSSLRDPTAAGTDTTDISWNSTSELVELYFTGDNRIHFGERSLINATSLLAHVGAFLAQRHGMSTAAFVDALDAWGTQRRADSLKALDEKLDQVMGANNGDR
jgi:hypothetical protein